jgi:peptidoglycan DL-endopeptidase CwlO
VRTVSGVAALAATAAALALILPSGTSGAQTLRPQPSLTQLVAEARQLSNEIDELSQQYDGLRIQMQHARTEARLAELAARRDTVALKSSQLAVSTFAAQSYMNVGFDPTLQLLTSGNPAQFLNEASTVEELSDHAGTRYVTLKDAQIEALRANETAEQQIASVTVLQREMSAKERLIQSKIDLVNSAVMKQAMAVFTQTGTYPNFAIPTINTVGAIALRYALSQRGKPYMWGAAGPNAYDCSGLVVWAFAQEGISLPHYTGFLWNSGMHVSQNDLQPGDLVFFYQDIGHVGLFIGDGLMVDAPTFGQPVQVQAIPWDVYVGAVRIA